MREALFAITSALVLTLGAFPLSSQAEQQSKPSVDTPVKHRKGRALLELTKPGHDTVVVEKDQSAPLFVLPPKGVSQLEWMTSLAHAVALIRIDELESTVTPDGDWVTTSVAATVQEVLKSPADATLSSGDLLALESDGGVVEIGGTTIMATLPWRRDVEAGARYIVFLSAGPNARSWTTDFTTAYQVDKGTGKIRGMARKPVVAGEAAVALERAVERIRAAASKSR